VNASLVRPPINRYHARLQRVLHYIEQHLEDDLSIEVLSGVAAFSKYHFHRQFSAVLGINVHKYVQLARLKRASYRLAWTRCPITEIAFDCGYAGPEAFSRAFKQRVGQTPREFRNQPHWTRWHAALQSAGRTEMAHMDHQSRSAEVKIIDVEDQRVALLEHRGDPALIGDSVRRFIAWRKQAGLPPRLSATFNIWYTDAQNTDPLEFRLGLCAATDRDIAPNAAGIVSSVIPRGRCAVLRVIGSDDALQSAAAYLYAQWLPESGEELRDFPPYCRRVVFFPDVPEHEAIVDIFLPLK
jgi:AraC family transcriptional regulator